MQKTSMRHILVMKTAASSSSTSFSSSRIVCSAAEQSGAKNRASNRAKRWVRLYRGKTGWFRACPGKCGHAPMVVRVHPCTVPVTGDGSYLETECFLNRPHRCHEHICFGTSAYRCESSCPNKLLRRFFSSEMSSSSCEELRKE